jgi:U3 small nucleolar RNA-associated protein 19
MPSSASATFKSDQFWVESVSKKPKKTENDSAQSGSDDSGDEDAVNDDWRKFFDDPSTPKATEKGKGRSRRIHTLSVHAQLHSRAAHRAVFTRCWLVLLPLLSRGGEAFDTGSDEELDYAKQSQLFLVSRALAVLHHNVLPHLTRPVLIMDWVASCVDFGGHVGLLALNALFILMKEYNLYVF